MSYLIDAGVILACLKLSSEKTDLGTLVALKLGNHVLQGVCTHVSDVKPHIIVATYTDAETGYELYQQIPGMGMHAMHAVHGVRVAPLDP